MSPTIVGIVIPDVLFFGFLFVLGAIIGSFLNVCIWRMPREESIVRPGSHCTSCNKLIAWHDNIPIVSYLALAGRCRACKAGFSPRYLMVEALTGLATIAVVARFGVNPISMVYLAFVYALIVITFVDLDFQIIPDEISVYGAVAGLVLSILIPQLHGTDSRLMGWVWSTVGLLVGGGLLFFTGMLGDFLFKRESMGGGDIKLLAMAGSILGWKAVTITFFLAPLLAVIPGLLIILFKKKHVIAYGPFLALALVVSLFAGDWVVQVSGFGETIRLLREYRN